MRATDEVSRQKLSVGELWEAKSGGRALFLMTVEEAVRPVLGDQIGAKVG